MRSMVQSECRRVLGPVLAVVLAAGLAAPAAHAEGFGGTMDDMLVRGESLLLQQRPREAMVQFQEVRTLCPSPVQIVSSLRGEGQARIQMGDILQAAGLFEEAADRFPNDPRVAELLFLAAQARQQSGDVDAGVILLRRALDSSPTRDVLPMMKFQLARALRLQGKPQEVVDLLQDFEAEYPEQVFLPTVLYTLAIAHHDVGDDVKAESVYREIIARFPSTQAGVEAQFEIAGILAGRGERDEAVTFYRSFASANPNSPVAARGLERAGDLLLFHSPGESALLYGLAAVKAGVNPAPPVPELAVSRWLPMKRTIAGALSRGWVVAVLGAILFVVLVGAVLLARRVMRHAAPPERSGA
jgi:TolA-binding protein